MSREFVAMGMSMGIVPWRDGCLRDRDRVMFRMRLRMDHRMVVSVLVLAILVMARVRSVMQRRITGQGLVVVSR